MFDVERSMFDVQAFHCAGQEEFHIIHPGWTLHSLLDPNLKLNVFLEKIHNSNDSSSCHAVAD